MNDFETNKGSWKKIHVVFSFEWPPNPMTEEYLWLRGIYLSVLLSNFKTTTCKIWSIHHPIFSKPYGDFNCQMWNIWNKPSQKLKHKLWHEILESLGNCNIRQFKFNYYQRQDIVFFSIAKCLIARLYSGCSNVNDGNSLIPYMVGFTSTNSFKINTITGYSSYAKELLDKALAMIVVPLCVC